MRIGLVVHTHRDDALAFAGRAAAYLTQSGAVVLAEDSLAEKLPGVGAFSREQAAPEVIVSLGGDGTLLRGVQYAITWGVPLLGINMGRVGFLSEIEPEAMTEALDALLSGTYALEHRPLLQVSTGGERWLALNDVVVSRGGYARLISVTAMVDEEMASRYLADGVIIATPTGSTGYSLSAGGPVVSPRVDCMVVTPICAHSLQHRPVIVDGHAVIRLMLGSDAEQTASLEVDGQSRSLLTAGGEVTVSRAPETVSLVRLKSGNFFQLVREKLTEWTR